SSSKMPSRSHHSSTSRSSAGWSGFSARGAKTVDMRSILERGGKHGGCADVSPFGHADERNLMSTPVTETTFELEVLQSDKPVIVDFWAEWCGPCHAVAPVLDKIAEERPDELKLVKVNIDEEQELARRYGIQSIPTIVLFRDGEPAAAAIGAQPKTALEKALGLAA